MNFTSRARKTTFAYGDMRRLTSVTQPDATDRPARQPPRER
jgi:hypothetical protein